MTTNPTDLAAALNECMPLTIDGGRECHECQPYGTPLVDDAILFIHAGVRFSVREPEIIGILWAECVRREWSVLVGGRGISVACSEPAFGLVENGTDALAFARAFAAAKRAEGGA